MRNFVVCKPELLDSSMLYRPEEVHKNYFRKYDANSFAPIQLRVQRTYTAMHSNQTVEYVTNKKEEWGKFDHFEGGIMEVLERMNDIIDESDPDVDVSNVFHAYQTAERIREIYPHQKWFQLTGLIHDIGKVMSFYDEPQWAVVGDTYPVGCQPQNSIVYRDTTFKDNPDANNPNYNTLLGMYSANCGLDSVLFSWGHDEYLYSVLHNHAACTLPEEALYMIRYHSFYPWHTGGDYKHLTTHKDEEMLQWVKEFNKFDLYTKSDKTPDIDELQEYYSGLVETYIPGVLQW